MPDQSNGIIKIAWKDLSFRLASGFLFFILFISIFSPFLANEKPLIVHDTEGLHFPVLAEVFGFENSYLRNKDWKEEGNNFILRPPIPWTAGKSDYANADYKSPFDHQLTIENSNEAALPLRFHHWMGTDLRGADVLAGIIQGTAVSLKIGLLSAILAVILGLIIGGTAGWQYKSGTQIYVGKFLCMMILFVIVIQLFFIGNIFNDRSIIEKILIVALLFFIFRKIGSMSTRYYIFSKKINIPLDAIVLRFIEVFSSFPKIVLILVFAGFFHASLSLLIFLLVFTGWPDFARIIRAEFIRISNYNYVDAAKLSGAKNRRIILKHILPNALVPITVTFVYAVAAYMLIEASLSFLGVGIPPSEVTWGSLLASGKENLSAWWLIIFPGLALTLTIVSFHRVAEGLQSKWK